MSEKVTEDMLMALADGELDAAAARDLRARVERDPDLARRYAIFVRSSEATRAAFADALREPPPAALVEAIRGRGQASAQLDRGRGDLLQLPMAAAIALAAGLTGYVLRGTDDAPRDVLAGLDTLFTSLAGVPAGQVVEVDGEGRAVVLESYETAIGPCRLAQLRGGEGGIVEAVGCLRADAWRVELAQRPATPDATIPAEGTAQEPVRAFLERLGASAPLGHDEEEERVVQGW